MNILVTGGNGFIGRKLCDKLAADNNIICIGRHNHNFEKCVYKKIDILDKNSLEDLFKKYKFDIVYHLASVTFHDEIVNNKEKSLEISLNGTQNLITLFNKYCNNAQFVYSSTGKVYGGYHKEAINENTPAIPENILGKSKYLTEKIIDYYCTDNKTNNFIILRIFNVYGSGQRDSFVIPHIINSIKNNQTIPLGNIDDKRDYIHVNDVISCLELISKKRLLESNIEIYNLATKKTNSVRDILNILEKLLNKKINIAIEDNRKRSDEYSVEFGDYAKLKKAYNWEPKIPIEDGLKLILQQENILD
ncbi:MAG: NAD(P)-dependent oxidoreductase [bacterium]|nr:NAD(P)-dependent oxidoreductase [bacterium]